MGSESDATRMEKASGVLEEFEIDFEVEVISAHRKAEKLSAYVKEAPQRGIRVFICGAGLSAALPGAVAAHTNLPVIGVPLDAALGGLDSLLSIAQMPPGVPVACVGVNNARNAAYLAVSMLGLEDDDVARRWAAFREEQRG
jgi:5-(carboxyamino)imidazole ribonucleotide mutase